MTAIYTSTVEGHTATRKSARHIKQEYFFAIWHADAGHSNWTCEAYSSRLDLAQRRAADYQSTNAQVRIVPVQCTIKLSKKTRAWVEARMAEGFEFDLATQMALQNGSHTC